MYIIVFGPADTEMVSCYQFNGFDDAMDMFEKLMGRYDGKAYRYIAHFDTEPTQRGTATMEAIIDLARGSSTNLEYLQIATDDEDGFCTLFLE